MFARASGFAAADAISKLHKKLVSRRRDAELRPAVQYSIDAMIFVAAWQNIPDADQNRPDTEHRPTRTRVLTWGIQTVSALLVVVLNSK